MNPNDVISLHAAAAPAPAPKRKSAGRVAWRILLALAVVLCAAPDLQSATGQAQSPPPAATFRIVAIAGGPRGAESGGLYRLDEIRSTFSRKNDSQVVVYFRWEGPPGRHRLAARWRGPGGAVSSLSEFEYDARDREFGAYWTLPLSPSTPIGSWAIDATINGLPSGSFAFEVIDADAPPAEMRRRPLDAAALYDRVRQLYAVIERSTPLLISGRTVGGLAAGNDIVVTTFAAVDATDTLRVTLPDGSELPAEGLVAWNRRQGWALLSVPAVAQARFQEAAPPSVGDRCYSVMGGPSGARILVDGTIVGSSSAAGRPGVIAAFASGVARPGAPVLDQFGDLLGIVGGGSEQAVGSLAHRFAQASSDLGMQGGQIIPLSALPWQSAAEPITIAELRRRGVLMPPVTGDHVLSGGFAREIARSPTVRPVDQRDEYSAREGGAIQAFITWEPRVRLKGAVALRLFDSENRPLGESKPKKSDLKRGEMVFANWQVSMPTTPGVYRVDVTLDGAALWRGFFRVTD